MPRVVLLGPQRLAPTLVEVVDALGIEGSVAAITAGWEERESEDQELRDHLGRRTLNLELYRRSEELFSGDPELADAYARRKKDQRELRDLYRVRLGHALDAARELWAGRGGSKLAAAESDAAVAAVRDLDAEHVERVAEVERAFEEEVGLDRRPSVAAAREEIAAILQGCGAVAVAGGHVRVLLARLRLFGLGEQLAGRDVFAWSAGAMALAERVVLFHDSPPQGAGNAEILAPGLGLYEGVQPFPHAGRRLRLEDPARVALLARRMAPARCVLLDEGTHLVWDGAWSVGAPARLLEPEGSVGLDWVAAGSAE